VHDSASPPLRPAPAPAPRSTPLWALGAAAGFLKLNHTTAQTTWLQSIFPAIGRTLGEFFFGGSESHADSERLARQSCREATLGMDCGAGEAAYKE
jgi:hypothetical protein